MPIQAAANKLKNEIKTFGNPPQFPNDDVAEVKETSSLEQQVAAMAKKGKAKKAKVVSKAAGNYQWESLKKMGIDESEIPEFAEAEKWLKYFPPFGREDLKLFGTSIDFRRSFITTNQNPFYDSFVRWQFNTLKKKEKISFGKRANVYSARDGQVCADHDRSSGEGVGPQEYVLIKIQVIEPEKISKNLENKKVFLAPATLRPETMYGQTNCYVLPAGDYGCYELANGDIFIMSHRAAVGLAHQGQFVNEEFQSHFAADFGTIPVSLATVKGLDLIGLAIKAPQTKYEVCYVLPLETISMTKGTGVVTSVPSDAPDDWIALFEMKNDPEFFEKKYKNLNVQKMVVPFEVVPVININVENQWESDKSAEYWCEKLEIKSQKDKVKLARAKQETYLHGFNNGTMIIGPYSGLKVSEAKLKVKEDMINSKDAILYFEPESTVTSRSGEDCIVAHTDQWYLNYGEETWRKAVGKHVDTVFEAFNSENLARFKYTLGWMKEWACSRLFGLGTKIPWDPRWVIESLSDSTIYMAYYSLAHILQSNLDGSQRNRVPVEKMTDDVWDWIFLNKDDFQKPPFEDSSLKEAAILMKKEFRYWYPMDLRVSGKDLITNHLTMCLYNHAAIWEEEPELWPRAMYCNGFVLLDNEKMSKSTGNFLMLQEACALYSADAVRFALADAGDTLEDANFSRKRADAAVSMLFVEEDFARKICQRDIDLRDSDDYFMDRAFANEMNRLTKDTTDCFEEMRWRDGILTGAAGLQLVRDAYREWCFRQKVSMRSDLMLRFVELHTILIAPICPHFAEHVWANILKKTATPGGKGEGTLRDPKGVWPLNPIVDLSLSRAFLFLQKTARSLRLDVLKEAKKSKQTLNEAYVYVTPRYPPWKSKTLDFMRNRTMASSKKKLLPKKDMLHILKTDPDSPCQKEDPKQTKFIMQFASFMFDYADEIGPDALDDTLPFDQMAVLQESQTYLENGLISGSTIKLTIFDLDQSPNAPGPDKAKLLADPGKPSIHVFASS